MQKHSYAFSATGLGLCARAPDSTLRVIRVLTPALFWFFLAGPGMVLGGKTSCWRRRFWPRSRSRSCRCNLSLPPARPPRSSRGCTSGLPSASCSVRCVWCRATDGMAHVEACLFRSCSSPPCVHDKSFGGRFELTRRAGRMVSGGSSRNVAGGCVRVRAS